MTTYKCDDGNAEIEIEADSAEEAAREYVDGGDWGPIESTTWINVYVEDEDGDRERVKVALQPEEPACVDGRDHDWDSPHELVGGCESNPGVWGHGGGVIITEACTRCGCKRTTDTWAQDRETGEQGLESVSYEPNAFEIASEVAA
jgi:hypothetical protein